MRTATTVLLLLVFLGGTASAQSPTDKNAMILGGSISFMRSMMEHGSVNTLIVAPYVYYFAAVNLALGLKMDTTWNSGYGSSSTYLGLGPALRYYFLFQGLRAFCIGQLLYNAYCGEGKPNSYLDIGFGVGMSLFLAANIALEPIIRYSIISQLGGDISGYSVLFAGIAIAAFLPPL
jgi:hypothetical protein